MKKMLYELAIQFVSDTDERARAILDVIGSLGGCSSGGVGDIHVGMTVSRDPNGPPAPRKEGIYFYANGDPVVIKAVLRDAFELDFDCAFDPNGTVEGDPEAVRRLAEMNARRKLERGESVAG